MQSNSLYHISQADINVRLVSIGVDLSRSTDENNMSVTESDNKFTSWQFSSFQNWLNQSTYQCIYISNDKLVLTPTSGDVTVSEINDTGVNVTLCNPSNH